MPPKIVFAPLEGLTDRTYRQLHHQYFGGIERYYIPFVSPTQNHHFSSGELRELTLNPAVPTVPQLLTKNAEDFLWAADQLAEMGYEEVNFNLGCPSGTVTAKGKGSGFLAKPEELERFLEAVFSKTPIRISVKTRIGFWAAEEFDGLLELYCRYPLSCLIVHPRTGKQMYRGEIHPGLFEQAVSKCPFPVIYNGDLTSRTEVLSFAEAHPGTECVMMGRGLLADPALARRIQTGKDNREGEREELKKFHRALTEAYMECFGSARYTMLHMKGLWVYLLTSFEESAPHRKRLLKSNDLRTFEDAVHAVFADLKLRS